MINVGISSVKSFEFLFYPNPTTGKVNFETSLKNGYKSKIIVYNILGKEVLTKEISTSNFNIDFSSMPEGIFTFKLMNSSIQYNGKIVYKKQ